MNVQSLARTLRTGGWLHHARCLGVYLAENGMPCTRVYAGIELRFQVVDGGLRAYLLNRGSAPHLVAEEGRVHLRRDQVRTKYSKGKGPLLSARVDDALMKRVKKATEGSRRTASDIVRWSVEAWLDARAL